MGIYVTTQIDQLGKLTSTKIHISQQAAEEYLKDNEYRNFYNEAYWFKFSWNEEKEEYCDKLVAYCQPLDSAELAAALLELKRVYGAIFTLVNL